MNTKLLKYSRRRKNLLNIYWHQYYTGAKFKYSTRPGNIFYITRPGNICTLSTSEKNGQKGTQRKSG